MEPECSSLCPNSLRPSSVFWARWLKSKPEYNIPLRVLLIPQSQSRVKLPSCLIHSGNSNTMYAFLTCPVRATIPRPSQPPWIDHLNNIWWGIQFVKILLMQFSANSWTYYKFTFRSKSVTLSYITRIHILVIPNHPRGGTKPEPLCCATSTTCVYPRSPSRIFLLTPFSLFFQKMTVI